MSNCRDNRRKTKRRRKRSESRLFRKNLAAAWPDVCPDGLNPDYYEPHQVRYREKGKWSKLTFKVRHNAKYHTMMKELIERSKGITIDVSSIFRGESGPLPTEVKE